MPVIKLKLVLNFLEQALPQESKVFFLRNQGRPKLALFKLATTVNPVTNIKNGSVT